MLKLPQQKRATIPQTLRATPDLIVESTEGDFINAEVKYRATWDRESRRKLFKLTSRDVV